MNPELYKLFMSYQNKELDDNFIYDAFTIMMKYETLDNYVNNFDIIDKKDNKLGFYNNEERIMKLNKNTILKDNSISNKKLLTLQVLRHELEHARNLKRLYEGRYDIETKIIRYSLTEYAIKHKLDYGSCLDTVDLNILSTRKHLNYNINPGDRIAEIKACKFIVNLLKNQRRTEDLLTARTMLYYSYIRGYKSNGYYLEPPTYEYLLALGLYHEHYLLKKEFNNTKEYSFNTRLLYGLPISLLEYNLNILQKVKLQKRKISKEGQYEFRKNK